MRAEAEAAAKGTRAAGKATSSLGALAYSDCVWRTRSNSSGDAGLEARRLANGYARLRTYDESFKALATLDPDALTPDAQVFVHWQRGANYYQLGELDDAHRHLLLAIESGRLPLHLRAQVWSSLMLVDFERGAFAEAAAHGERSRADYFAAKCTSKDAQLIAKLDMQHAKYLSHADREKALHYARSAVAKAAAGTLDPADLEWLALLEAGPAPASIRPLQRPWLEGPPAPVSEAEVLRHVIWIATYRKLIPPPPEVLRASADPDDLSPYWDSGQTVHRPPSIEALKLRLPKPTVPPPAIDDAETP